MYLKLKRFTSYRKANMTSSSFSERFQFFNDEKTEIRVSRTFRNGTKYQNEFYVGQLPVRFMMLSFLRIVLHLFWE
jgi:hypothetical protein